MLTLQIASGIAVFVGAMHCLAALRDNIELDRMFRASRKPTSKKPSTKVQPMGPLNFGRPLGS